MNSHQASLSGLHRKLSDIQLIKASSRLPFVLILAALIAGLLTVTTLRQPTQLPQSDEFFAQIYTQNKHLFQLVISYKYPQDPVHLGQVVESIRKHPTITKYAPDFPVLIYAKPSDLGKVLSNVEETRLKELTNAVHLVRLENVGRDPHTVLYHLARAYVNGLAAYTMFLTGAPQNWFQSNETVTRLHPTIYNRLSHFSPSKTSFLPLGYFYTRLLRDGEGGNFPFLRDLFVLARREFHELEHSMQVFVAGRMQESGFIVARETVKRVERRVYEYLVEFISAPNDHYAHNEMHEFRKGRKSTSMDPVFAETMERAWGVLFDCWREEVEDRCLIEDEEGSVGFVPFEYLYALPATLSVCSAILLIRIGVLVVFHELPARKRTISLDNIFTPTNSVLIASILSGAMYLAFESLWIYSVWKWEFLNGISYLCLGMSLAGYIWFAWLRASNLVKRVASAFLRRHLLNILYITAGFCIAPGIIKLIPFRDNLGNDLFICMLVVASILVFSLDVYFIHVFIHQIIKMESEIKVNQQLNTIAKYGLLSSCSCFISMVTFLIKYMLDGLTTNQTLENETMVTARIAFGSLKDLFLFLTMLALYQMKVVLVHGILEEGQQSTLRIAAAVDINWAQVRERKGSIVPAYLMPRNYVVTSGSQLPGNRSSQSRKSAIEPNSSGSISPKTSRRNLLMSPNLTAQRTRPSSWIGTDFNLKNTSVLSVSQVSIARVSKSLQGSQSQLGSTTPPAQVLLTRSNTHLGIGTPPRTSTTTDAKVTHKTKSASNSPRPAHRRNTENFTQGLALSPGLTRKNKVLGSSTLARDETDSSMGSVDSNQST
ncbi:hypothetical protein HDU79_001304 [Rhizoclosmatium sp. JEL0117]|nr:hypothetical protein HDU79_001304 [Rhizoclosmatium sp. JEL0117]